MPELPEVETVCRGLADALEGETLYHVHTGPFHLRRPLPPDLPERLNGRTVQKIWRRGKYYIWTLDSSLSILGHLGMSGSWRITQPHSPPPTREPHDHLSFRTASDHTVTYRDPRRFGLFLLTNIENVLEHPLLKDMGPEPLSNTFCGAHLQNHLRTRKGPVKTVLLDQKVVAGIGNIYASEALYRAGVSPERPAYKLSDRECSSLVAGIRDVLSEALLSGGSSLRDHITVQGTLGYFQHKLSVYGRTGQPCTTCTCDVSQTGGVRKITQAGRSTFFCASRQP